MAQVGATAGCKPGEECDLKAKPALAQTRKSSKGYSPARSALA